MVELSASRCAAGRDCRKAPVQLYPLRLRPHPLAPGAGFLRTPDHKPRTRAVGPLGDRLGTPQCNNLQPRDGVLMSRGWQRAGGASPFTIEVPIHRLMQEKLQAARKRTLQWLGRTPVQTFILCPLIVVVFELALRQGRLILIPWGVSLLVWGYLQYLYVGRYRLPRAGGTAGIGTQQAKWPPLCFVQVFERRADEASPCPSARQVAPPYPKEMIR
jgi:hypothetical protein